MCGNILKPGARNIFLGLFLVLLLFPVSLSADDFQNELTAILNDFDEALMSLEGNWQQQRTKLIDLNDSVESLTQRTKNFEQISSTLTEQHESLSSTVIKQEKTLQTLEQSVTDLQHSLSDTQKTLSRAQSLNKLLIGGFAVSAGLAVLSILL
jgi:chromosome segregation ATPase